MEVKEMDKETVYIDSSLGKIPSDWKVHTIDSLFELKNGINASKDCYGEGVKFVNVMEIIYNEYITSEMIPGAVQITEEQKKLYKVKDGDVLFNRTSETTSEIGLSTVYYGSEDVVFGGFVIRGRSRNEAILKDFRKYCFRSEYIRDQIIKGGQGAVRSNIGQGDLGKVIVGVPPLFEQRRIADCLSSWDEAITKTTQLIAQKELQKKWLMQQLLTGKKRLKGFCGEWKILRIKEVAKEVSIRNKTDKQLTVLSCTKYDGLVPSLEYFGRKIFADDISTYKVVPQKHFAYATNHIEEGSIGYQDKFEEALISPMYTVFKTDDTINDYFFYKLLKSHRLIYQYNARMEGSIDRRGGLRWDAFSIIKIYLPNIEEQTAIAKVLQAADRELELLKTKAGKLKEEKRWLMQQLLTGKKRLKIENN